MKGGRVVWLKDRVVLYVYMCCCFVFFLRNRLDLTLVTYQKREKTERFVEIQKGGDICIPLADSY